jgi:hypothetical protein
VPMARNNDTDVEKLDQCSANTEKMTALLELGARAIARCSNIEEVTDVVKLGARWRRKVGSCTGCYGSTLEASASEK